MATIDDENDPGLGEAAAHAAWPPAGWVDGEGARRMLGITRKAWYRLLADGRIPAGRWFAEPGTGAYQRPPRPRKLYAVSELEPMSRELGDAPPLVLEPDGAGDYQAPAGYVDWRGACAMFGVMRRTLSKWQTQGKIGCPRWAKFPAAVPGDRSGARRVYPVAELARLVETFAKVGQPYPDPQRPGVWRVPVISWTHDALEAIVDAADMPRIAGKRWNWAPATARADAKVILASASGEHTAMRRIILGLDGREWRISHANGDPLDCRRANLVVRDYTEQQGHARKRKTTHGGRPCTSRFKGVSLEKKTGKWVVKIKKESHTRRLGYFRDEIAAAEAYDEAARELFGEHARLNFPDGIDAFLAADGDVAAREAA